MIRLIVCVIAGVFVFSSVGCGDSTATTAPTVIPKSPGGPASGGGGGGSTNSNSAKPGETS